MRSQLLRRLITIISNLLPLTINRARAIHKLHRTMGHTSRGTLLGTRWCSGYQTRGPILCKLRPVKKLFWPSRKWEVSTSSFSFSSCRGMWTCVGTCSDSIIWTCITLKAIWWAWCQKEFRRFSRIISLRQDFKRVDRSLSYSIKYKFNSTQKTSKIWKMLLINYQQCCGLWIALKERNAIGLSRTKIMSGECLIYSSVQRHLKDS